MAVLAGFAILGAWRGLLRTLAGLLVLALSLAGAGIIASALSAPAAKLIAPVIEKRIEARLDEAIQERRPQETTGEGLPLAELLCRALDRPLRRLGGKLGLGPQSLTGMLVGLATPLPALSMYQDMDRRGKVAAGAFLVSGASLLAAHMGFVIGVEPDMLLPLIAGKLSGALAAAALALWLERGG